VLCLLTPLVLFATRVFPQDKPSAAAVAIAQAACGPSSTMFEVKTDDTTHRAAEPEPDKAMVYVVEVVAKSADITGGPTMRVGLDGTWLGANRGNSYLFFSVAPGEHHLCANWQSRFSRFNRLVALASLSAEGGKTYYFRSRIIGQGQAEPYLDLDPVNGDEGRFLVVSSPVSASRPKK
jgi:hypothetical protein